MTGPVQLIPEVWKKEVIQILRRGDRATIEWTWRAGQDWQQYGVEYQAYAQLAKALNSSFCLGRQVTGMTGSAEIWEFLLPHPLGSPVPVYAKIGLKEDHISIKIFSTHIDLKGELEKAIQTFLKRRKK